MEQFWILFATLLLIAILIILFLVLECIISEIVTNYKLKHSTMSIKTNTVTEFTMQNNTSFTFIDDKNKYLQQAVSANIDYLYEKTYNDYIKVSEISSINQFLFEITRYYYKNELIKEACVIYNLDKTDIYHEDETYF